MQSLPHHPTTSPPHHLMLPYRRCPSIHEGSPDNATERVTSHESTSAQESCPPGPVLPLRQMPHADPQAREALQDLSPQGGGLSAAAAIRPERQVVLASRSNVGHNRLV